jgi:hypothetical protein
MGSRGVQDTECQESANMRNLWRRGRRHNQAGLPSRAGWWWPQSGETGRVDWRGGEAGEEEWGNR